MKKLTLILSIMLTLVTTITAHAAGIKVGAHGAYNIGGDIDKSVLGFGADAAVDLPGPLGLEVSATRFKWDIGDDTTDIEAAVIILAASVQTGMELGDLFYGYVGGGISYNMWDEDIGNAVGYHFCLGAEAGLWGLEVFGDYSYTLSEIELGGLFGTADIQYGVARVGARYRF